MSRDWAQLKQKRAAKERPSTTVAATASWIRAELPPSLRLVQSPDRGRGLAIDRVRVRAGTTVLATSPLVSVLDARNLPHRCSHCYRSVDDLDLDLDRDRSARKLLQCSLCHTVQYCSPACQNSDWPIHKKECVALRAAVKRRRETGTKHLLPDAPLRALARLLWSAQIDGSETWKQVESLESHRARLSAEEQERFFQLSVSLSAYVGQETLAKSCPDGTAVIDLCSRFVSNSFALTCPTDLSNIGVSISPVTALINHSCVPNAVVVFPSFPESTSSASRYMAVVALRDLEPDEEVVTSYVDLSLPRRERQRELMERYKFQCRCEGCTNTTTAKTGGVIDPREAMLCPAAAGSGCEGLIAIPDSDTKREEVRCPRCGATAPYRDVQPALDAAKQAYLDADRAQYDDPRLAALQLSNLISTLTTSLSPAPPLAPSAYPLYSALQLLLTVQLHAHEFDAALATSSVALRGARALFPAGHPVLALLLTTHARLVTTPPASEDPEREMQYWMATERRVRDVQALVAALRHVEVAFGDGGGGSGDGDERRARGGGEMAKMLRMLIRDQEEGIEVGRRMKAARAAQRH